jgi:hypothetical protein
VIGGVGYTPSFLKAQIQRYECHGMFSLSHFSLRRIKEGLTDKNAPFGIDLLLPKVTLISLWLCVVDLRLLRYFSFSFYSLSSFYDM